MAEYRHSAHAAFDLKYHVIWCTKYRYKILRGRVAERARDLIRQICQTRDVVIIRGAVSPDHIHMLLSAPPVLSPAKLAQYIKGRSSRHLQAEFRSCENGIGVSICGHEGTSARRWARLMRQRSKPISRARSGTKTTRASRSQRPPSLQPALSRNMLQTASAAPSTFSRVHSTGFKPVVVQL
jgi:REP element-mobilizing transposase RayT